MSRITALMMLFAMGLPLAGCIIEPPPGPGPEYDRWCANYPWRCHR